MKVIAKSLGFYGDKRRYPGEEFTLVARQVAYPEKGSDRVLRRAVTPEEQFSETWMERVEAEQRNPKGKAKASFKDSASEPNEI